MIGMMTNMALELVENHIPFHVSYMGELPVIYVKGNDEVAYIRISYHEGDPGYYIRNTGAIFENQTIKDVMIMVKEIREM